MLHAIVAVLGIYFQLRSRRLIELAAIRVPAEGPSEGTWFGET
jgi:hypothetical protein